MSEKVKESQEHLEKEKETKQQKVADCRRLEHELMLEKVILSAMYSRCQNKLCIPFCTNEYETLQQIVPFSSFFHPSVLFRFALFLRK